MTLSAEEPGIEVALYQNAKYLNYSIISLLTQQGESFVFGFRIRFYKYLDLNLNPHKLK